MAFCKNCGQQLAENSNFCHKCGTPVVQNEIRNEAERKMVYDGEIHKCPNCGAVLDSFTAVCPQCGFELRGSKATNSVREFALKLEEIESKRIPNEKRNIFLYNEANEIDKQKSSLIRNFVIPNNKEDIIEFIVLASSNIDIRAYHNESDTSTKYLMSEAWRVKIEQAYLKAKLTFPDDLSFQKVDKLYNQLNRKIKFNKHLLMIVTILAIIVPVLCAVFASKLS